MMLPRFRLWFLLIIVCLLTTLIVAPSLKAQDVPTETPSEPPSPTLTEPPQPSSTLTETPLPTPTATFTEISTLTLEPSLTATPLPSATATVETTGTETETATATNTETPTATGSASATLIPTTSSTATASATPIGSNLPVLYSESFENPNMSQWLLPIDRLLVPSGNGQALRVTNRERLLPVGPGYVGDVVVQGNFQITSGGATLAVRESGVGWYKAILNVNGQVSLYKTQILLATAVVLPSSVGQWRNLQLAAISNSLSVIVDGVLVLTVTDIDPLPPGTLSIGVETYVNSDLLLDDLLIRGTIVDPNALPPGSYVPDAALTQRSAQQISPMLLPAGSSGKIVYQQNDPSSDREEIYIVDANGSNPTRLTNNIASDYYPALSTNGQIAFVSNRDGNRDLYTMNADGSNVVRRTNSVGQKWFPDWSPDNTKIAFNSNGLAEPHVFTLSNGTNQTLPTAAIGPKWSPDGQKFVFHRGCGNGNNLCAQVFTANSLDGSNEQLLTPFTTTTWANASPDWSPDGSEIAYVKFTNDPLPQPSLIVMDSISGVTTRVLATVDVVNQSYQELSWSPDGTQIVFNEYTPTGRNMSVVSSQGGGKTVLNTTGGSPSFGLVLAQQATPTPTPTVTPTPTATPCPDVRCQIRATLETYGVVVKDIDETASTPGVGSGYWTDAELEQLLFGVQNTGEALNQFSTVYLTDTDAFKNILLYTPATDQIEFEQRNDLESTCRTTARQPGEISSTVRRATISCGGNNVFTQYTATHELGHVFLNQTTYDTHVQGASVPACWPFIECIKDPAPSDTNVIFLGDSGRVFVFGRQGAFYTRSFIQSQGGNPDEYSYSDEGFTTTLLFDWERGTRGWGSGAPNPGACGAVVGSTPTSFQQNPCKVIQWVNPDGTLEATEQEETGADMFLNWVYRDITQNNPNSDGFENADWVDSSCASVNPVDINSQHPCYDVGLPGDVRFDWMNTVVMQPMFTYFGW